MSDGRWPAPGVTSTECCGCGRTWSAESASDCCAPRLQPLAFLLISLAMSTFTSCPIPGGRDRLPDCYSTTPGGTLYATTPGGQQAGLGSSGSGLDSVCGLWRAGVGAGVGAVRTCTRPQAPLLAVVWGRWRRAVEHKPSFRVTRAEILTGLGSGRFACPPLPTLPPGRPRPQPGWPQQESPGFAKLLDRAGRRLGAGASVYLWLAGRRLFDWTSSRGL